MVQLERAAVLPRIGASSRHRHEGHAVEGYADEVHADVVHTDSGHADSRLQDEYQNLSRELREHNSTHLPAAVNDLNSTGKPSQLISSQPVYGIIHSQSQHR